MGKPLPGRRSGLTVLDAKNKYMEKPTLFDLYRHSKNDKLHKMYFIEVREAEKWLERNYLTTNGLLSYYSTALAIGLDFGDEIVTRRDIIKSLQEEMGMSDPPDRLIELCLIKATESSSLPNPEQMVRYYERTRILKSRRIKDVADFIVQQDISTAMKDDVDEIRLFLAEVGRKARVGQSIKDDIIKLSTYFDVDEREIKKYIKEQK